MSGPAIKFVPTADASVVSDKSREVLRDIMRESGVASCVITCTSRTPAAQALAMYRNLLNDGVARQKQLYRPAGDLVIDEFVRVRDLGGDMLTILAAMEARILEIGPGRVSLHCADPALLNVIDIAPSSISRPAEFLARGLSAVDRGVVKRLLSPLDHDPAFHLEIPQS